MQKGSSATNYYMFSLRKCLKKIEKKGILLSKYYLINHTNFFKTCIEKEFKNIFKICMHHH